ncbi:MAG: hypothetical protein V1738_06485 [Patescibacteria group bacterium]
MISHLRQTWQKKFFISILLLPVLFLLAMPIALAETTEKAGSQPATGTAETAAAADGGLRIVPACATDSGVPQLDCVLLTLGNIAQLILALTGSLALLMFVYGGFLMLSSGGSSSKVEQGKNTLKAAVTGILIVLLAGYLIRWGLSSLNVNVAEFQSAPKSTSTEKAPATETKTAE